MKVYRVSVKKVDWDQFDSAVILADSKEEVLGMFKHITNEDFPCENRTVVAYDEQGFERVYFYDSQGEIEVEEVTTKGLVLESFNAG